MKGCKWLKIAEVVNGKAGTKMQGSLSYSKKKKKKELVKIPERQKQMKVKCQLAEFKQRLHFVLCRFENKQFQWLTWRAARWNILTPKQKYL